MSFYQFMKLTLILCGNLSSEYKAKCIDAQVRCYEEIIKPLSGKTTRECFKIKQERES